MARRVIRRRRPHGPDCRHCPRVRALGRDFQCWRASWEAAEERSSYGYAAERALFREERPAPTFRVFLEQMAGSGWPMSGRASQGVAA